MKHDLNSKMAESETSNAQRSGKAALIFINELALVVSFLKRRVMDQRHIRSSVWSTLIKETQVDKSVPLFKDREQELKEYFRLSTGDLRALYFSKGFPNTGRYKLFIETFFAGRTGEESLKPAYSEAAFYYVIRLMLAYERYTMLTPYLDRLSSLVGGTDGRLSGVRVLEYGCGVSDMGLLCNLLGARVTICDLSDSKLAFAEWRHRKRNLDVTVIPIHDTEQMPELGAGQYNLVIATEIFEHVRNPLRLLTSLTKSLRSHGVLFDSMGGVFERELRGDHLAEALEIGNSDEFRTYYERHYSQPYKSDGLPFLFMRI